MTGSVILINNYITCNMYFKLDALGAISSFIFFAEYFAQALDFCGNLLRDRVKFCESFAKAR